MPFHNFEQAKMWFESNLLSLIFGIIGIIGIVVSYIFYRWSIKEKKPFYAHRNLVIVKDKKETFPDLKLLYQGHSGDLDNLSVSVIAIWNGGRETIHKTDITSGNPLRIKVVENCKVVKILGASILQATNKIVNIPKCIPRKLENDILVTFEYLDYNQGFVIQLLHTGKELSDIHVVGTIKGGGEIKLYLKGSNKTPKSRHDLREMPAFPKPHGTITKIKKNLAEKLKLGNRRHIVGFCYCLFFIIVISMLLALLIISNLRIVAIGEQDYAIVTNSYEIVDKDGAIKPQRELILTMNLFVGLFFCGLCSSFMKGMHLLLRPAIPPGLNKFDEHLT